MDPITRFILLENKTTNGDGAVIEWTGLAPASLQINGTWDGATVTVYGSCDEGVTWLPPNDSVYQYTADVLTSFSAGRILVKATVSDAGVTTSLSACLIPTD